MVKLFMSIAFVYMLPGITLFAQKQSFDVVSFISPKGWQQQQNEGGVQFSVTDSKTGAYAIILITRANLTATGAADNFNSDWIKLVKAAVQVNNAPNMQDPATESGWEIISGTANYTDGVQKGLVTLLTATGGGQMASVVLMTNTLQYQNELLAFINSLELAKAEQSDNITAAIPARTSAPANTINSSLAGKIWEAQSLEKHGASYGSMSGFHTGGFWLYQYKFNADGTYHFVYNAASAVATNPVNILQYETGTYTVNGNSITITPARGANEEWTVGKINNGMSAEMIRKVLETRIKRLKTTARKLEKNNLSLYC